MRPRPAAGVPSAASVIAFTTCLPLACVVVSWPEPARYALVAAAKVAFSAATAVPEIWYQPYWPASVAAIATASGRPRFAVDGASAVCQVALPAAPEPVTPPTVTTEPTAVPATPARQMNSPSP